jgi:circadian clock protein KaiB
VSEFRLKLFVAGDSSRAREAATNLARACERLESGVARIETVDILRDPAAADEFRVLTTPTVVRISPAPRRRVTGDFRDAVQVLQALDLHHTAAS